MILSKSFGMIQSGRVLVPVFLIKSFKCRYCWTQASTGTWQAGAELPISLDLKMSYFPRKVSKGFHGM